MWAYRNHRFGNYQRCIAVCGSYQRHCPQWYRYSCAHSFHDSCMVRYAISVPVKEDNHAGHRSDGVSGPLPPALEPLNTIRAAAEFRKDTSIKIATLVGAPAYKTGTPFYMFRKSVPAPIGFPSYIAKLRSGNLYNQLGVIRVIENLPQRVVAQHMENPGSVPAKQDRSLATRCRR